MARLRMRKHLSGSWQIVIGLSALADWLSTLMNRRLFWETKHGHIEAYFRIFGQDFSLGKHELILEALQWLDKQSFHFGLVFSILWCVEAFLIADKDTAFALREWERRKHMRFLNKKLGSRKLFDEYENPDEHLTELQPVKVWLMYYAVLVFQLMCLPVGFYLFLFEVLSSFFSYVATGSKSSLFHPNTMEQTTTLLRSTYGFSETPEEFRVFSNETKLAFGFAVAKHSGKLVYDSFYKPARLRIRKAIWREGWKNGIKLGFRAIKQPFLYWKHAKNLLSAIRWILYLSPLIRSVFQLSIRLKEARLSYKQLKEQKVAEEQRRLEWNQLKDNERKQKAAKRIQSTYRSYRERQQCLDLIMLQREVNELAALKLQMVLLAMLERKRLEQQRIKREQRTKRKSKFRSGASGMSREESRLRALRKQQEREKSESIDLRLLMRPRTKFQMIWKSLGVFYILSELFCRYLNHWRSRTHKSSVSELLEEMLTPDPAREKCDCDKPSGLLGRLNFVRTRRHVSCIAIHSGFCHPYFLRLQSAYAAIIRFLIERSKSLVAILLLLVVPVSFYTGTYDKETGMLIPKPFIQRFVLGLFLQLLTNPKMEAASHFLYKMSMICFETGPVRFLRWVRVLFKPVCLFLFDTLENHVMAPLVVFANRTKKSKVLHEVTAPLPRQSMFISSEGKSMDSLVTQSRHWSRRRSSIHPNRISIFVPLDGRSHLADDIRLTERLERSRTSFCSARLSMMAQSAIQQKQKLR